MKKRGRSRSAKGGSVQAGKKRSTAAQRGARDRLSQSSRGWNDLTEEQRTAWGHLARSSRSRTRRGRSYPLDGQKVYNKLNTVLALCGLARLTDPPPQPRFGESPVAAFQITGTGRGVALQLILRFPPAEHVMYSPHRPATQAGASVPTSAFSGFCQRLWEAYATSRVCIGGSSACRGRIRASLSASGR
jgi:hypothetical protein